MFEHEIDKVSDSPNHTPAGSLWRRKCPPAARASEATASALVGVTEPSADLLVTEALLTERVLEPNQVVRVDATVANHGGANAMKSQLRYLLSADSVWDEDDTYLNYDAVPSLSQMRWRVNMLIYGFLLRGHLERHIFLSSQMRNVLLTSLKKRITSRSYLSKSWERKVPNPKISPSLRFRTHHSRVVSRFRVR